MNYDHDHWHIHSVEETLHFLDTTTQGVSDVEERRNRFGHNEVTGKDSVSLLRLFLHNANSVLIYILLVAATLSWFFGKPLETYVILAIIAFTIGLSVYQEYSASKVMQSLQDITPNNVTVRRSGEEKEVQAKDLVPGDIVLLGAGDLVPADLRVCKQSDVKVDESILTGESEAVSKHADPIHDEDAILQEQGNLVFSGTSVVSGSLEAVVIRIGDDTEIGQITQAIQDAEGEPTQLEQRLDELSTMLGKGILIVCTVLFALLLSRGEPISAVIILLTATAVSGIPESLPIALTFGLSKGVKRMAENNAVIRELNAVETLGSTTVICTDKTGTLTQNKMLVTDIDTYADTVEINGTGYDPSHDVEGDPEVAKGLLTTAALCNEAKLRFENGEWSVRGDPTEGALLTAAESTGIQVEVLREERKPEVTTPFSSDYKYMVAQEQNGTEHMKGALEVILDKADKLSAKEAMTRDAHDEIIRSAHSHQERGKRVLGFAKNRGDEWVYQGFVAMQDPLREDAQQAVNQCQNAHIDVVMITGDHKATAKSIAEDLGILTEKRSLVLTGKDIEKRDDNTLRADLERTAVCCRVTPLHKERIVRLLREEDEVVAMTGDGVNDAPALQRASIGVSMASGTEVARQASDMVLLDNAFSTIVEAVKEGRTIYSNIRRFTYYLLTGNFTEVAIIAMAVLLNFNLPLTALMILFINLVTSTFPALALSVEPTHSKVMHQYPRKASAPLLDKYLLLKIGVLVPILLLGTYAVYFVELGLYEAPLVVAQSAAFATLIVMELFHTFNARRLHTTVFDEGFLNNKAVFASITVSALFLVAATHTEAGNTFLETAPLDTTTWILIISMSSAVLFVNELIKLLIKSEFDEQERLHGDATLE